MQRKIFSILTTLFFFYVGLWANSPIVRNFYKENYKAGTQNWSIAQDEQNRMYFANNAGLLQYDGNVWTTTALKSETSIRSLLYGKDGCIYISTFNDFGYFKKENNRLVYHSLAQRIGIDKKESNALYNIVQAANNIYFQGENSIFEYDGKNINKISLQDKINASAFVNGVLMLASENSGAFVLNGKQFMRLPGSEILMNKKVCSILSLDNQTVLFVTNQYGVYAYNGISITKYNTGIDNFLMANQVFCAARSNQLLAFGTVQKGAAIINLTTKSVQYVNTFSGLQNNTVLSMTFDRQQNLWLGLDKGIDLVVLNVPVENIFGKNNLYGAGYSSIVKDEFLYMATNQGLFVTPYPFANTDTSLQPYLIKGTEGQVWNLTEIDNTLFGGDDQGAFIVRGTSIERIKGLPGTWNFKPMPNHPNLILGCSYKGLFMLKKDGSKWFLSHFLKGNFKESSPLFEPLSDGSVWFSHWQKGLFKLQLNAALDSIVGVANYGTDKGLPTNRNNTFFKIKNSLVFSSEGGFFNYNANTDRMVSNTTWNGLFASKPAYIRLHESPKGDVWCVSGRFLGLARIQKDGSYRMDSTTYRILQSKILQGFEHFLFINNQKTILSTEDGFSIVNTNELPKDKSNFQVLISNIIASKDSYSKNETRHIVANLLQTETFPKSHNSIRIEYNAPEYREEGMIQYSYKLENYDNNWSEYTTENRKEYNKLPRGKYIFRVRARNLLESNEVETSYEFRIAPAWYESSFAFVIYFLLLIVAIVQLYLFVKHKSAKGAREMEERKEREIEEHKKAFEAENAAKKKEIKELKNQQLQYELRHKSQELASSTMNLIRKNEMLLDIVENISKVSSEIKTNTDTGNILTRLGRLERTIKQNIENDNNWKRFEENFDLVYENYLKRIGEAYPNLNTGDKRLCAYLKMDLSSKDIAPLLNMSVRSIEMNRYRLRKKMDLDRDINLAEFLQRF
jgi:ligand-binding sensor domain-containing protein